MKFALSIKGARKIMKKRGRGTKVLAEKGQNEPEIRKNWSKMAKNLDIVPQGTRTFLGSGGTTSGGY